MKKEIDKVYNPKSFEDKIYKIWEEKKYFHAEVDEKKEPFTIMIPPPNITARLHIGHALDETIQDIIARFKRMQGKNVLWLPGTDHASIATEVKIVEQMKKEGIEKKDIGREEFLKRAWKWKSEYGGTIIKQLKKLGSSCDWDRERFTLDEGCSEAVNEVFVNLYKKGLIYRGERIINWCPECLTSISDAEVEYVEQDSNFYHINYKLKGSDDVLEVATTRPETILGDTAVAVNPNDERYNKLIGKTLILPLIGREIPIVGDDYVDMEFGTGVVKITPAHDPNDFEIGLRHNLPIINILNDNATLNDKCGKYKGMDRVKARKEIVNDLKLEGSLVKVEPYKHNVGQCYRCHTTVEPKVSTEWFVKMKPLAEPAIKAVKDKKTEFVPQRFEKIYFHWMENIKDWCISRQLWWGHRIPAWHCEDCKEIIVSKTTPQECSKCKSKNLKRDEDTLDTWFSSGLWPFSTLGWPKKTKEYEYFYPTSVLVTAYDIIFFWVARMIFQGLENTNNVPFKKVLMHGLVRDSEGRKMSKSLGNGIDPLKVIDECGADALRFMLSSGTNTGNDMRYSEEKVKSARNYANKLWNAARFVLQNLDENEDLLELPSNLTIDDMWFLTKLNNTIKEVTINLENFDISIAAQKIYDFSWNIFCDWYIELIKIRLTKDKETSIDAQKLLLYGLTSTLKLIHPFMPFITEEIYQKLPRLEESIMISKWPISRNEFSFKFEEEEFEKVIEVIKGIRNIRAQMNVPNNKKTNIYIQTQTSDIFKQSQDIIKKLANGLNVEINSEIKVEKTVQIPTTCARVFIPSDDLIDKEKEILRLEKEREKIKDEIEFINKKLNNKDFISKAPANVVGVQKEKLENAQNKLDQIEESIKELK